MAAKKKPVKLPLEPLSDLLAWWRKLSVKGMVIGGLAVALRGRPRTTKDVDAIALVDEVDWPKFLVSGANHHLLPRDRDALDFAQKYRVLLLRHEPSGVNVDVSLGSLPYEKEAIARATYVRVGRLRIPLVQVEDLIILKGVAHRQIDLIDIISLLEIHPELDVAYIRRWLDYFAQELEVPEIFTAIDTLLTRSKQTRAKPTRKKKP